MTNEIDESSDPSSNGKEDALRLLNSIKRDLDKVEALLNPPLKIDNLVPFKEYSLPDQENIQPVHFTTGRARRVRQYLAQRRRRDQFFPSDLFADPAWDMLLDLYAAHHERSRISISSLCIAAAVPATTALRWIKTMEDAGLFVRSHDQFDGRRVYIELSEDARSRMDAYFKSIL